MHGLHAVREVRERVAVRVAIDETAAEPGALGAGVADAVCLKISRCGGIAGAARRRDARARLRRRGLPRLDARRPARHRRRAARRRRARLARPAAACGLATLGLFEGIEDPLPARERRDRGAARPGPRASSRSSAQRSTAAPSIALATRRRVLQRQRRGRRATTTQLRRAGSSADHAPRRARGTSRRARRRARSTGIASSPSRSHSGAISPVPSAAQRPRRARAGRCGAGPRARARRPRGGSLGEQRLRAPALDELLERRRSRARRPARSSAARRARALARVLDARRCVDTSTSRCTRSGAASATCSATRPPSE